MKVSASAPTPHGKTTWVPPDEIIWVALEGPTEMWNRLMLATFGKGAA